MTTHTPGPWHVSKIEPSEVNTDGRVLARTFGDCALENARLIAAAPDLLAALKDVRGFLRSHGYDTRLVDAAIDRADENARQSCCGATKPHHMAACFTLNPDDPS